MPTDLDSWLSALDAHRVRSELTQMEARANKLAHEHRRIEDELTNIREEIEKARAALALKERFDRSESKSVSRAGRAAGPVDEVPDTLASERPAPGREAIRAVVRAMPEVRIWSPRRMLEELRKRGWTEADDTHAVQVSMSRMAGDGEFVRPGKGRYMPRFSFDAPKQPRV